jgi:tellurium resistance protein TerZ
MAINLQKGQRIDLRKSGGATLTEFCVGVNWGAIEKKGGFLGFGKSVTQVDLDLSCVMIDSAGQVSDHLYSPDYKPDFLAKFGLPPGKLLSRNNALRHSGDDRAGDSGGDDGLDNEVITVNLTAVEPNISQIFFFLNNVGQEDFSMIPYAKIRMYEGTPTKVKEVFADYNVAAEAQYAGKKALIMGKLYKKDNEWKFNAIGDPTEDVFLGQTIHRIVKSYL